MEESAGRSGIFSLVSFQPSVLLVKEDQIVAMGEMLSVHWIIYVEREKEIAIMMINVYQD